MKKDKDSQFPTSFQRSKSKYEICKTNNLHETNSKDQGKTPPTFRGHGQGPDHGERHNEDCQLSGEVDCLAIIGEIELQLVRTLDDALDKDGDNGTPAYSHDNPTYYREGFVILECPMSVHIYICQGYGIYVDKQQDEMK